MVVINHFVKTGSVKFCDSSFFWSLSALLRALTINDSTARPAECNMDNCVIAMDLTVFAVPTLAPCNIFLPSRLCFTSGRARRGWHARLADDERRQTVGVYIAFIRARPSGVESWKEWNILVCNLRPPKSWTWMFACFSHRRSLITSFDNERITTPRRWNAGSLTSQLASAQVLLRSTHLSAVGDSMNIQRGDLA